MELVAREVLTYFRYADTPGNSSGFPLELVPGMVAGSVERGPRMQEIGNSVPCRIKPMTYQTDTCRFLAWHSALTG